MVARTAASTGSYLPARSYDDIAEWYDAWVHAGSLLGDPFFGPVDPLLGDLAGQRICDLACGQGRVARYLAASAAHVVGVDLSGKLLAIAQRYESATPNGISYLRADAQGSVAIRDAVFDGVICHMALMDIPDLTATIRGAARLLRPGGWFIFSVLHPCYNTPTSGEGTDRYGALCRTINGYWTEGYWRSDDRPGPPGQIGAYHRTLSTYLNTLLSAGFALEHLSEPRPSATLAVQRPIWDEVPAALIIKCRKRE
jgi:2-polyprenyl-3-methyl-5-hydroxy-6-metoxy-1,4-benzoquinol methylase